MSDSATGQVTGQATGQPTDWMLTQSERGNPGTVLDDHHAGDQAWSTGNRVRSLVHGAVYFRALYDAVEATRAGDLVYFTDWQGDADERLVDAPGGTVVDVLARADERGVDVRGLVWRSHSEAIGFTSGENRRLGRDLQKRGAEALLDMRVRLGGSHHQKMVVIRYAGEPSRDVAFIGGIDLCHSRHDDAAHGGDPQPVQMAEEYGETPPWHDVQSEIRGPAVYDAETVFRERWLDPTPLSRNPINVVRDRLLRMDLSPDPLPDQAPPPPPAEGGTQAVQLLRTYPDLRHGLDYPFARGGERSVARGYTKALRRARRYVFVEDQYLWGHHVGDVFSQALHEQPDLVITAVLPQYPDVTGATRVAQLTGRRRAMIEMLKAGGDRVAFYGLENPEGTPVYVHAKTCVVDDTWATIGSDNFNRRSWTHDSELSAAVVDLGDDPLGGFGQRLRLRLGAEHLGRLIDPAGPGVDDADDATILDQMGDCVDGRAMFDVFAASARALDDWHAGGCVGPRPPGQLRRMQPPHVSRLQRVWARPFHALIDDPDGRPKPLRKSEGY